MSCLSTAGDEDTEEHEEGEWIPDDPNFFSNLSKYSSDEGIQNVEIMFSSTFIYFKVVLLHCC